MRSQIIIAAAVALSATPLAAQSGWTLYAPGYGPTESAVTLYGDDAAVTEVRRKAESWGWTTVDKGIASKGKSFVLLKSPAANIKGIQIWQAARDAGVAIGPLLQRERAGKSPAG